MAITYNATAFNSAGTTSSFSAYKDLTFTGVASGDLLVVSGHSEGYYDTGTAPEITTQSGSTGSWTTSTWNQAAGDTCSGITGYVTASGSGTVVVRVRVRVYGSAARMGAYGWHIPAADWTGTPTINLLSANDGDGQLSVAVADDTAVFYSGGDWSATNPGTTGTPSGGTNDTSYYDGSAYSAFVHHWTGQASGTRNYGPSGLSGKDFNGAVVEVPEATGPTPITGTSAVSLPAPTVAAAGTVVDPPITGTAAVTLPAPQVAAAGTVTPPAFTGTAAVDLPAPPTVAAAGTVAPPGVTGTAAVVLPAPVVDAAGTVTGPPPITGTAAVTLPAPTVAATGTHTPPPITGTAAITLPVVHGHGLSQAQRDFESGTWLADPPLTFNGDGTATLVDDTGGWVEPVPPVPYPVPVGETVRISIETTWSADLLISAFDRGTSNGSPEYESGTPTAIGGGWYLHEVEFVSTAGEYMFYLYADAFPFTFVGDPSFRSPQAFVVGPHPVTVAATGTVAPPEFTGPAATILPAPTVAASGTVTAPEVTGTAAVTLPAPTVSAAGTVVAPGATFTTLAGDGVAEGAPGSLLGGGSFATIAGDAVAAGEVTVMYGGTEIPAVFSTTTGDATAGGASGAFVGGGSFATTAGDATGAGAISSLVGGGLFTTLTGDGVAEGAVGSLVGGTEIPGTFSTLAGDATGAGGTGAFTATATFTTLAGDATAAGAAGSLFGGTTFSTLTGGATAGGDLGALTGAAVFTTFAGDAAADGGTGEFTNAVTFSTLAGAATADGGASSFSGGAVYTTLGGGAVADGSLSTLIAGVPGWFITVVGEALASGGSAALIGCGVLRPTGSTPRPDTGTTMEPC